jgi:eukaryotic-like serine/threonine-protein kinase
VLHRDIKPSNLILDGLGNIWITDFGLAKFEDADDLTHSQDLVGTLRFMAPERFRGVSDPRCDVYALGATLYEMVTLRPCFSGESHAQLIHRIEHEPPVPPRQIERGIPADLETIVLKALSKAPGDRFESAEVMHAELLRYVENRPIRSRPIPAYQRFWRWCKRNPGLATAGMLASAAIIALVIVSLVAARTFSNQLKAIQVEQQQTRNAERNERLELGNSLLTEGAALQRSGLVGQRFDSLDRLRRATQILGADPEGRDRLPEIRNHVITGLGLVDLRVLLERNVGNVRSICFDAALERYAFCEPSGEYVVCRLGDGHEILRLPAPGKRDVATSRGACFSPDGGLLVTVDQRPSAMASRVTSIWHLEHRELLAALESNDRIAFDHDGRHLAFATRGGIGVWDVSTAPEHLKLHAGMTGNLAGRRLGSIAAAEFSPDGQIVATAADDGVRLWDADEGRELAHLKAGMCGSVLFDSDSHGLVTTCRSGVYRWPIRPDSARGTMRSRLDHPSCCGRSRGQRIRVRKLVRRSPNAGDPRQRVRASHPRGFSRSTPGLEPRHRP